MGQRGTVGIMGRGMEEWLLPSGRPNVASITALDAAEAAPALLHCNLWSGLPMKKEDTGIRIPE